MRKCDSKETKVRTSSKLFTLHTTMRVFTIAIEQDFASEMDYTDFIAEFHSKKAK